MLSMSRLTRSPQPPTSWPLQSPGSVITASSTGGSAQGLICDATSTGSAALLTYTGSSISYNGMALSCTEPGQPAVLTTGTGTGTGTGTVSPLEPTTPGTVLIPQQQYSLETSPGQYVKVDNFSSPAYVSTGNGSTIKETFTFTNPTDPTEPINPGEPVLVKSNQTGMYCRVVNTSTTAASGSRSTGSTLTQSRAGRLASPPPPSRLLRQTLTTASPSMVCDVLNPAYATNFTWTGTTITYNGAPLSAATVNATTPTSPATFSNSTTNTVAQPTFSGPSVAANTPITISTTSGCLAVDSTTYPMYSASPCSTSPTQQFVLQPANGSTTAAEIQPGEQTIIQSVETGLYCRVATLDGGQQGMVCDVSSPSQATPVTYTGTGLSYGGQPLAAGGAGQALLVSPGATSSTSSLTLEAVGAPATPGASLTLPAA
jgi:hypothetical protein